MAGIFDELQRLEQAVSLAVEKVPDELRPHYEREISKHLRGVRLEFARYVKKVKDAAKPQRKKPRSKA